MSCTKSEFYTVLIILIFGAFLASCGTGGHSGKSGTEMNLVYTFSRAANSDNIDVYLEIESASGRDQIELFNAAGTYRIRKISSDSEDVTFQKTDRDTVLIDDPPQYILIEYTVVVGQLAKHGKEGIAISNAGMGSGEQLLLMPLESFSTDDEEVRSAVNSIRFFAEDGFAANISMPPDIVGKEVTWFTLFQIRKSAFVFADFITTIYEHRAGTLYIGYFPFQQEALDEIKRLFDYFCEVFEKAPENLEIILLGLIGVDIRAAEYVFAGGSIYTIGATFNPDDTRDWELLAHRMFHAFFDTNTGSTISYMPPNLWLYEGLASYYETKAMESIGKIDDPEVSYAKMYADYLYMALKDPFRFSIAPMDEAEISMWSPAAIEFLHYRQAPLIVWFANRNEEHIVLNKFLSEIVTYEQEAADSDESNNETNPQLIPERVLMEILDDSQFIEDFLSGTYLLSFWDYMELPESVDIITHTALYEREMLSWLIHEQMNSSIDYIDYSSLAEIAEHARQEEIAIADEYTSERILAFSPGIYDMLLKHKLRIEITGIDYFSPTQLYDLTSEENVLKWRAYISDIVNS